MDSRHDERGSQTGIGFSMREVSYFLSDAHIGAGYITDPGEHERRLVALLHEMERMPRRFICSATFWISGLNIIMWYQKVM